MERNLKINCMMLELKDIKWLEKVGVLEQIQRLMMCMTKGV